MTKKSFYLSNLEGISNTLFDVLEKFKEVGDLRRLDSIIRIIHPGFVGDDEDRRLVFMNEIGQLMKMKVWYELTMDALTISPESLIGGAFLHFINYPHVEDDHKHSVYSNGKIKLCSCISPLFDDNVCGTVYGTIYVSLRCLENKNDKNEENANIKHLLMFAGRHPGFQRYLQIYSIRHERITAALIGASDRGLQILPNIELSRDLLSRILVVTREHPQGDNVVIVK